MNIYDNLDYEDTIILISVIYLIIIGVIGLFGNCVVLSVAFINPPVRSITNFLIVNLAISEILFIIFNFSFYSIVNIVKYWPLGDYMCKITLVFSHLGLLLKSCILCLMLLDRIFMAFSPICKSLHTDKAIKIITAILWIASSSIVAPGVYIYGTMRHSGQDIDDCIILYYKHFNWYSQIVKISMNTSYVLLFLLFIGFYGYLTIQRCCFRYRSIEESQNEDKRGNKLIDAVVITSLVMIIAVKVAYWLLPSNFTENYVFWLGSVLISNTNMCITPILYCIASADFRRTFINALLCSLKRESSNNVQLTSVRTVEDNDICSSSL